MSCIALNGGITLDCSGNAGGIRKLYITDYENIVPTDLIMTNDVITDLSVGSASFYEFEFNKNSASFTENLAVDIEAGSAYYAIEVMFKIGKRETAKRNILKLMVRRKLSVIALDSNGIYWLLGQNEGLYLTELNSSSGQAKADGSFYEFKIAGDENFPAMEVLENAVLSAI
jgi:hypothetical protein